MWPSVHKPALIHISLAAVLAALVLENSTEAVEVLRGNQDLAFINIIVVLFDADEFALEIGLMDLRRKMRVLQIVKGFDAEIISDPDLGRLHDEEVMGHAPLFEEEELIAVLSKILSDQIQLRLAEVIVLLLIVKCHLVKISAILNCL